MPARISINIHTIEGDVISIEVEPEEQLEAVFRRALEALQVDPSLASNYYLVFNGQRLDLHQSVEGAGIAEGADLILTSQPQVG